MEYMPHDATTEEIAERQVLRDGVPDSMRASLTTWIWNAMQPDRGYLRRHIFDEVENNLDVNFGIPGDLTDLFNQEAARLLLNRMDGKNLLRIADFLLFRESGYPRRHDSLNDVLSQGRSKWEATKREKGYRLSERVPEGVQVAAEALMSSNALAGQLLRRAWFKAYDLNSDDSGAYMLAVRAVETAALPALGITKEAATLDHAIRAIEQRDATWRLPFLREHTQYPSRDVMLGMLRSLYRGHRDRHGSDAYSDVTHEEAEAAVLMAVSLVGWFARGLIQQRDTDSYS